MDYINSIKKKNNLPLIFFGIIIIRFFVTIIFNSFTKEEFELQNAFIEKIFMLVQILLLVGLYAFNYKEIKINKRFIIMLLLTICSMTFIQIKNFILKDFYVSDLLNIGFFFCNVFLFYVVLYDFKIDEKCMAAFFKCFIGFAVLAIIWNLFLFNKEILAEFGIVFEKADYSYLNNPKGFFSNRNTLAFFIFLAIIANSILIKLEGDKKVYKILFFVLWFGVWCTHSKTAYLVTVIFLGGFVFFNDKLKIKQKIIMCTCIALLTILGGLNILGRIPINILLINKENHIEWTTLSEIKNSDIFEVEKHLTISSNRVKKLSGRTAIWKAGIGILRESPLNIICGVGKVKAKQVLNDINGEKYMHFHSIYLEIMLNGGILELLLVVYIYYTIIKKIIKSDLKNSFKRLYIMSYITYFVYILFESFGRFSTSPIDVVCLIFFVSLPLLHANSTKNNELDINYNEKG